MAEGQQIFTDADIAAYESVYGQVHPLTGEKLGRAAVNAGKARDRQAAYLARLLAAEPHATADRRRELAWQATAATRPTAPYTDVTVSFSKSISVLRAGLTNAVREELIPKNVAALVRVSKPRKTRKVKPWSVDEARHFLEDAGAANDPLYAAYVLILALGLRKGEVLGLGSWWTWTPGS